MSLPPQEIKVEGKAARIRGATWTQDQVKKLFDVWTQPDIYQGLLNEKKKLDIFKNMASILSSHGVHRTWRECRAKMKNLKADFRKALEKKTPFRYFEEMKRIMNVEGSGADTRMRTIDSFFSPVGGASIHSQDSAREIIHTDQPSLFSTSPSAEHPVPSTSRSVIQRLSDQPIYQKESSHDSQGHLSWRSGDDDDSSSYNRFTPPPSTSKSSVMTEHSHSHMSPHYFYQNREDEQQRQSWRQLEESRGYQEKEELRQEEGRIVEHDSSSRSSMIITHVVSNVIEPVTQIVMPSSCGSVGSRSIPDDTEIIHESVQPVDKKQVTPPPIRLEFLLDDENVILQSPRSPTPDDQRDSADVPTSPQTMETDWNPQTEVLTTSTADQALKTAPLQILKKRLDHRQRSKKPSLPKPSFSSTPTSKKRKPPPTKPTEETRKRKLLETISRKTVETISDLLTETSQNLLKELQDAEQRFIFWEEEKRNEERKREEIMFTKLIQAMKFSSSPQHLMSEETENAKSREETTEMTLISNFSNVSKRINEMVCGEVKQTEETVRQWESKMQRQESRHTEKLFGIIINAIKTSTSTRDD